MAFIKFLISIWIVNTWIKIIKNQDSEYNNVTESWQIESQPFVAGPVICTNGISEMLHITLEPSLFYIPHTLKDSFHFLERLDTTCTEDTLLSSCDIQSTKLMIIGLKN